MNGIKDLITAVSKLISSSITLMVGAALLVFLWGLARFIFKSGDPKTHEEGRNIMIWGIVALFVMTGVWGVVHFFQVGLGLNVPPDNIVDPIDHPYFQREDVGSSRNI